MTAPRLAPALALDFPDVPDDAPPVVARPKSPRVWTREALRTGPLCDCSGCKAAAARIAAAPAADAFLAGVGARRAP